LPFVHRTGSWVSRKWSDHAITGPKMDWSSRHFVRTVSCHLITRFGIRTIGPIQTVRV
jgi:hypothetical protein